MKKLNFKKVIGASVLALLTLIELFALGLSKANKVSSINLHVKDSDNILNEYIIITDTQDGGESGYYIELPQFINYKQIEAYEIEEKEIIAKTTDEQEENEATDNSLAKVEKKPGDKLFLTQDELNDNQITLEVKYDKKEIDNKTLYNTRLQKLADEEQTEEDELNTIELKGYIPNATTLKIAELSDEENELLDNIDLKDYQVAKKYIIQLGNNGETYENKSEEDYFISISPIDGKKEYKVFMLGNNDGEDSTEQK